MMDRNRKVALAIGLVLLWIGLAYWQWGGMAEPVRVPLTNVSGVGGAVHRQTAQQAGLRVNLELLAAARTQRETSFTAPRNIFAVPRADGTLPVTGEIAGISPPEQVSQQTVEQQAAALELAQYRYLGFVRIGEATDRRQNMAVLSKDDEVVVRRAGQALEPHLVVKAVTPENVTLRNTQAHLDHTVPLMEEAVPVQP